MLNSNRFIRSGCLNNTVPPISPVGRCTGNRFIRSGCIDDTVLATGPACLYVVCASGLDEPVAGVMPYWTNGEGTVVRTSGPEEPVANEHVHKVLGTSVPDELVTGVSLYRQVIRIMLFVHPDRMNRLPV